MVVGPKAVGPWDGPGGHDAVGPWGGPGALRLWGHGVVVGPKAVGPWGAMGRPCGPKAKNTIQP